ncbi:MAG: hypothetical protein R6X15_06955 [Pseudomonadota bacterium]
MEKWHVSEIYKEAGIRLFAVFATVFHCSYHDTATVFGNSKPVAVIVCRGSDSYALDTEGGIIPLDELAGQVPEIDTLIAGGQSK